MPWEQRNPRYHVSRDSDPPVPLGPDRKVTMSMKTFAAVIGVVAIAVASWWSIKSDVNEHSKQLEVISERLSGIERDARLARDSAAESRSEQRMLKLSLDYLVNDRRGPKPATSSTP